MPRPSGRTRVFAVAAGGGCRPPGRTTRHFSMGELRGVKRDNCNGGHRVPLIVRWPAVVTAESHCTELVSLMATCADAIDPHHCPPALGGDSVSMLPRLNDADAPTRDEHVVHSYFLNHFNGF